MVGMRQARSVRFHDRHACRRGLLYDVSVRIHEDHRQRVVRPPASLRRGARCGRRPRSVGERFRERRVRGPAPAEDHGRHRPAKIGSGGVDHGCLIQPSVSTLRNGLRFPNRDALTTAEPRSRVSLTNFPRAPSRWSRSEIRRHANRCATPIATAAMISPQITGWRPRSSDE